LTPLRLNEHVEHEDGEVVFRHACKNGPRRGHRVEAEGLALSLGALTGCDGYEPTREAAMAAFAKKLAARVTPKKRVVQKMQPAQSLTQVAGTRTLASDAALRRQGGHNHEKRNRASPSRARSEDAWPPQ
jgi:hypothetical protein